MPLDTLADVNISATRMSLGFDPSNRTLLGVLAQQWNRYAGTLSLGLLSGGSALAGADVNTSIGNKDDSNPGTDSSADADNLDSGSKTDNLEHSPDDTSNLLDSDHTDNLDHADDFSDNTLGSKNDDYDQSTGTDDLSNSFDDFSDPTSGFPNAGTGDSGSFGPDLTGLDAQDFANDFGPSQQYETSPDVLSPSLEDQSYFSSRPELAEPGSDPSSTQFPDPSQPSLVGLEADNMSDPFAPELQRLQPKKCDCKKKKKKKSKSERTICYEGRYTDKRSGIYYKALREVPCEPKTAHSERKVKAPKKKPVSRKSFGDLSKDVLGL
jgi:hypothetical protein